MEGGGLTPGTEYGGLTCELYCIVRAMIEYSCRKETGDRRNCGVTTGLELRGERLTLSADLSLVCVPQWLGRLLVAHARAPRSLRQVRQHLSRLSTARRLSYRSNPPGNIDERASPSVHAPLPTSWHMPSTPRRRESVTSVLLSSTYFSIPMHQRNALQPRGRVVRAHARRTEYVFFSPRARKLMSGGAAVLITRLGMRREVDLYCEH